MNNRFHQCNRYNNINSNQKIFSDVISNNTSMPETSITDQQFGFLEVTVFSNNEIPIENALVTIYILDRFSGEAPVQVATTNGNGKTPIFTVPTEYYLDIGQDYYFTSYNVRVDAIGYYTAQTNNVHFYPGITSVLTYRLNPIPVKIPGINLEQIVQIPPSKFEIQENK